MSAFLGHVFATLSQAECNIAQTLSISHGSTVDSSRGVIAACLSMYTFTTRSLITLYRNIFHAYRTRMRCAKRSILTMVFQQFTTTRKRDEVGFTEAASAYPRRIPDSNMNARSPRSRILAIVSATVKFDIPPTCRLCPHISPAPCTSSPRKTQPALAQRGGRFFNRAPTQSI